MADSPMQVLTDRLMPILLTIAVPSYNRAAELDRQLAWLHRSVAREQPGECEVIISDNASTDDTPSIIARWRDAFESIGVSCRTNRNECNRGPLPNIATCIKMAAGRFVWVIGDDDEIPEGKLAWVTQTLRDDPDLASIVLNFQGVGKTVFNESFHFDADQRGDGRVVLQKLLSQNPNSLGFMSAQVYRTEFAQEALRFWPGAHDNYDSQIFISAYVGSRGRMLATRDTHMQYVTGGNVYEKNKRVGLIISVDTLDVFLNLHRAGFDGKVCRRLAWRHLWGIKRRFVTCALRANPLVTIAQVARGAWYLLMLSFI